MFKAIGAVTTALSDTITGIAAAIKPLTNSLELGSKSIELHAQELYEDTQFECDKNRVTRTKLMKEFNAELEALED